MNNIIIEFCPEDRARIDRLIAAMENKACERCVESALEALSVAHESAPAATPVQQPAAAQPAAVPSQSAAPVQPTVPYAPYTPPSPPAPTAPVTPVAPVAAPTTPVTPVQPVAPTAPTAAIPTGAVAYDMDTIARAGSALIDRNPANIGKLMELLAKYGTNAITTLAKEHYGAFVTDLRALGAPI